MRGKDRGRLEETFRALKEKNQRALITFITAGDPDLATTCEIVLALEKAGSDIIELGIPFSDPMADGPTIQASSERALKAGTTLSGVLRTVKKIRRRSSIPIVLFGYYNPVFTYGLERFARDAKRAGVDGVLIVDLPPEESGELKGELQKVGLDLVYLLTPTSDTKRMQLVTSMASGFIYYVSLTGVTGERERLAGKISTYVRKVRKFTNLPVVVGFGISRPEHARAVGRWADGVVVGSALVRIIEKNAGSRKTLLEAVEEFTRSLKAAMKG